MARPLRFEWVEGRSKLNEGLEGGSEDVGQNGGNYGNGTGMETDKLACSQTETPLEKELWLVDQLTVLAEAFGECEKVSPQRLQIYAGDVPDLDQRQLDIAFKRALS
jgi:hypothetical protein